MESLIEVFAKLPGVRLEAGRRHRLDCILASAAVGVLAGDRTITDVAAIAAERPQPQWRARRTWFNRKKRLPGTAQREHLRHAPQALDLEWISPASRRRS